MIESSQKGLLTELQCQADFTELGILLSQPITQDSRYDFIADINGCLVKIQCKTASVDADETYIKFSGYTTNVRNNATKLYTEKEVDYFYTCYKDNSYLIPQQEVGRAKTLRFSCKENNPNISWAKDFELNYILQKDFDFSCQKVSSTVIKKTTTSNKCAVCGEDISESAKYCISCSHLQQHRAVRPSREELKKMIKEKTFVQIGKDFNVSDNAVRKWCRKENLPSNKSVIKNMTDEEWDNL